MKEQTITLYGTKIKTDIPFPFDLSHETQTQGEVALSSAVPESIVSAITCGLPLYWAHGRNVYLYSDRSFDGSEKGQPWCYEVKGVVTFYWIGGERTVYYVRHNDTSVALLSFWFIHLLLPLYFALEGVYDILHGGAVEIEGKAVLFAAPSMGGKSTMTDYFIGQGHTMISDDKIPTFVENGRFMLAGSHPYHRPYRKFEDLGYRVEHFSRKFLPLHAMYLLEKAELERETVIEEIRGFEKFNAMLPHYLYTFPFFQRKRMVYLSRMMNRVRVFRVKRPWDMEKLPEVYRAITAHSRSL